MSMRGQGDNEPFILSRRDTVHVAPPGPVPAPVRSPTPRSDVTSACQHSQPCVRTRLSLSRHRWTVLRRRDHAEGWLRPYSPGKGPSPLKIRSNFCRAELSFSASANDFTPSSDILLQIAPPQTRSALVHDDDQCGQRSHLTALGKRDSTIRQHTNQGRVNGRRILKFGHAHEHNPGDRCAQSEAPAF